MRSIVVLLAGALAAAAWGQTPYHSTPDWISTDSAYSTGAALVDLNLDGWLDLVVSNGNDMARQRLAVYYNDGTGHFPPTPSWQSDDLAYNGHLSVADVNGDGWPDVAVALLLNEGGPAAKLYINHNGTLSSLPEWTAAEFAPAFTVCFGDVNNDGRPDLAVGTGDAYSGTPHAYKNFVYLNIGGQLESSASWKSDDTWCFDAVMWADVDNDGWLDLIGGGSKTYTWVYHNAGGTLATTATWHTTDTNNLGVGVMLTAGDVTGDGRLDLFFADNNQLGGTGRFREYNGQSGGYFSQTANWSYYDGYVSAVALADIDADGLLDLATGAWWDKTRIFFNNGAGFGATPGWNSGGTSVVEKIVFGDIRKQALRTVIQQFPDSTGRRLFYLQHQPIQELVSVRRDGVTLTPDQYTCDHEHGWVTVAPDTGLVELEYTVSSRLDMAISNWDPDIGNYVYYNQLEHKGDANCDGCLNAFDIDPFVLVLIDLPAYHAIWPYCDAELFCDMNDDGAVNAFDIDPFVAALVGK